MASKVREFISNPRTRTVVAFFDDGSEVTITSQSGVNYTDLPVTRNKAEFDAAMGQINIIKESYSMSLSAQLANNT